MKKDPKKRNVKTGRKWKTRWKRIVSTLAAITVFCTTYALILPAITVSSDTYCGLEEHEHTEECYELELICGLEEGQIEPGTETAVENEQSEAPVAQPEETQPTETEATTQTVTETVTETVIETEIQTVIETEIQEVLVDPGHTHQDSCYEETKTLVCGQEEIEAQEEVLDGEGNVVTPAVEGHTHTDACYQVETVLVCGEEEREPVYEEQEVEVEKEIEVEVEKEIQTEVEVEVPAETIAEEKTSTEVTETPAETVAEPATTGTPHVHTEECYKKVLKCGKEEHKHTDECFSNPTLDLESASDWEKTLPKEDKLTGNWAEDVLTIAKSQLGYKESSRNFAVVNGERKGYNRYGVRFGAPYSDWCAMFIQFCMHYAGVDERLMPANPGVGTWIRNVSKMDNYFLPEEYTPQPGDIMFIDWDSKPGDDPSVRDGDHVGLVAEVKTKEETTADGAKIEIPTAVVTIEGNLSKEVKYNTYKIDDDAIMGYSRMPEKPETEEELEKILEAIEGMEEEEETVEGEAEEAEEAEEGKESVEGQTEEKEEGKEPEEGETEEEGEEPVEGETEGKEETEEGKEPVEGESEEEGEEPTEETKTETEKTPVEAVVNLASYTESGVLVKFSAPNSVFPEGVKDPALNVVEILPGTEEYKAYVAEAESQVVDEAYEVTDARFFDIKVVDVNGQEIQLVDESLASVEIIFPVDGTITDEGEINVVHFADEGLEVLETETEGKGEVDSVSFDTPGFSVFGVVQINFTVDYYYGEEEYHQLGRSTMLMSELFGHLGIERSAADIINVEFTDYTLVAFNRIDDDYEIVSLIPFTSHEELTITMNDGEVIVIGVEDAIYRDYWKKAEDDNTVDIYFESYEGLRNALYDYRFQKSKKINLTIARKNDNPIKKLLVYGPARVYEGMNVTIDFKNDDRDSAANDPGSVIGRVYSNLNTSAVGTMNGPFLMVDSGATLVVNGGVFTGTCYDTVQQDYDSGNTTSGNTKPKADGGIFVGTSGNTTFNNTQFININKNTNGVDAFSSSAAMNNAAPIGAAGGSLTLNNCTIKNNYLYQPYSYDRAQSTGGKSTAGAIIAKNTKLTINGTITMATDANDNDISTSTSTISENGANGGIIILDGVTLNAAGTGVAEINNTIIKDNKLHGDDSAPIVAKNGTKIDLNSVVVKGNLGNLREWKFLTTQAVDSAYRLQGATDHVENYSDYDNYYFNKLNGTVRATSSGTSATGGYIQFVRSGYWDLRGYGAWDYRYSERWFQGLSTKSTAIGKENEAEWQNIGAATGYLTGGTGITNYDTIRTAGAVLLDNATVNMNDKTKFNGNVADHGAVLIKNGTLNQSSGTEMKNNRGYNAGAVGIGSGTFNMYGGKISNNKGVWFGTVNVSNSQASFNMGSENSDVVPEINNNTTLHKGGAVYVNSSNARIVKGQLNNNEAYVFGGAIYLEKGNTMQLTSAVVTGNDADYPGPEATLTNDSHLGIGNGGGLWTCATGESHINADDVVFYNNKLRGNADAQTGGVDIRISKNADKLSFTTSDNWKVQNSNADPAEGTTNPVQYQSGGVLDLDNTRTSVGSYNVEIKGNKAPDGGGIASNGDFVFTVESNEVGATLKFTKSYDGAWRDVKITVQLKNGNQVLYNKESLINSPSAAAAFTLPTVLWRKTDAEPAQATAYRTLNTLKNNLKVGVNDLGNGWKLLIREQVKGDNNNWIDVVDLSNNQTNSDPANIYQVTSNTTVTEVTQNNSETVYSSITNTTYQAVSSLKNVDRIKQSFTVEKTMEGLYADGALAYTSAEDKNKIYWVKVKLIRADSDTEGYTTVNHKVTYSIFNENGLVTGNYYAEDGVTPLSKDKETDPNASNLNPGERRLHWVIVDGNNNSKEMRVPLRAGEKVIFNNIPVGAKWYVEEEGFTSAKYDFDQYEYMAGTNPPTSNTQSTGLSGSIARTDVGAGVRVTNKELPGTLSLTKTVNGAGENGAALYGSNRVYEFRVTLKNPEIVRTLVCEENHEHTDGCYVEEQVYYNYAQHRVYYNVYENGSTEPIKTALAGHPDYDAAIGGRPLADVGGAVGLGYHTIKLKAGQTAKFENLPLGANWSVQEVVDSNMYSVHYTVDGEVQVADSNGAISGVIEEPEVVETSSYNIVGTTLGSGTTEFSYSGDNSVDALFCLNRFRKSPTKPASYTKSDYDAMTVKEIAEWSTTLGPAASGYTVYTKLRSEYYNNGYGGNVNTSINTTELAKLERRIANVLYTGYHGQALIPQSLRNYGINTKAKFIEVTQQALYMLVTSYRSKNSTFTDYMPDAAGYSSDSDIYKAAVWLFNQRDNNSAPANAKLYIYKPNDPQSTNQAMIGIDLGNNQTPEYMGDADIEVVANNTEQAGSLTVGKEVTGSVHDEKAEFTFEVTIGGTTHTVKLKEGETHTIDGIPIGTSWTVEETNIPAGFKREGYRVDAGALQENVESVSGTIEDTNSTVSVVGVNKWTTGEFTFDKVLVGAGGTENQYLYGNKDFQFVFCLAKPNDNNRPVYTNGYRYDPTPAGVNPARPGDGVYYNIYEISKDEAGNEVETLITDAAGTGSVAAGHADYDATIGGRKPENVVSPANVWDSITKRTFGLHNGHTGAMLIKLKGNQRIRFFNVPAGAWWDVREVNVDEKYYEIDYAKGSTEYGAIQNNEQVIGQLTANINNQSASVINRERTDVLKLTKTRTGAGNNGTLLYGQNIEFEFKVTLKNATAPYGDTTHNIKYKLYDASGNVKKGTIQGHSAADDQGVRAIDGLCVNGKTENMSIKLKAGESIEFINLPKGTIWNIEEVVSSKYALQSYTCIVNDDDENPQTITPANNGTGNQTIDPEEGTTTVAVTANNKEVTGELSVEKVLADVLSGQTIKGDNTAFTITGKIYKQNDNVQTGFNYANEGVYYNIFENGSTEPVKGEIAGHAAYEDSVGGRKIGGICDSTTSGKTNRMSFTLKANQKIVFYNLPIGAKWEFSEVTPAYPYSFVSYKVDGSQVAKAEGTITKTGSNAAVVVNNSKDYPELWLEKVDNASTTTKLDGAEFQLIRVERTFEKTGRAYINVFNPGGTNFATDADTESVGLGYGETEIGATGYGNIRLGQGDAAGKLLLNQYGFVTKADGTTLVHDSKGYILRYMPTEVRDDNIVFVTGEDGRVNLGKLPDGKYHLVETKAPSGYNKMTSPIIITVSNGVITAAAGDGAYLIHENGNGGVTQGTNNGATTYTVKAGNSSGQELPETGGIGTTIIYILGAILVVGAGVLLVARKKNKKN